MKQSLSSLMVFCLLVATSAMPTVVPSPGTKAKRLNNLAGEEQELSVSTGKELEAKEHSLDDPELTAGYFQGDMIISMQRNGLVSESSHWPNHEVFYKISSHFDTAHREYIMKAMDEIMNVTCIKFKPAAEKTTNFVYILSSPRGCFSQIGFKNRVQLLNLKANRLGKGCFRFGSILHELMHTLGFVHQQSSPNRNEFVKIVKQNIADENLHNFDIYPSKKVTDFGLPYDYESVLHYSAYAFTINGEKTIETLQPNKKIGQRRGLSSSDIEKINAMYKCSKKSDNNL